MLMLWESRQQYCPSIDSIEPSMQGQITEAVHKSMSKSLNTEQAGSHRLEKMSTSEMSFCSTL